MSEEVAQAAAELEAARRVITAARKCLAVQQSNPEMHDRLVALSSAIHAYDKSVTAQRPGQPGQSQET